MNIKCFEDLEIWQLARKLTNEIYNIPFGRDFGLANQMQRASVSIMSNIAEGFERDGNREFIQFLYIAKASCGEIRSQLYIAHDLGYIKSSKMLIDLSKTISVKTRHLIKHLKENEMKGIKYKVVNPMDKYQEELKKLYNEVKSSTES